MNYLDHLILNHVAKSPSVVAVLAVALTNVDRAISFALKYFSAQQIDAAIDKADAAAKARVDADAVQQKPKS